MSRYVRELANYLSGTGFYVKIVSRMGRIVSINTEGLTAIKIGNMDRKKLRKHGSSSLYFMLSHLPNPLTTIWGTLMLVKDVKNEHSFKKIIHVHDTASSLLIALIISKIFNIPFLVQIHGFPIKEQKIKLLRADSLLSNFIWFLTKIWSAVAVRLMKHCTVLLVNNEEVKSFYESYGISSKKLKVVPSAIDLRKFKRHLLSKEEAKEYLGLAHLKNVVIIGFVGALRPEKNVETLVKAFGELMKSLSGVKVHLIIIGDGPMKPNLKKHVKEQGVDCYTSFLGYIPDAYRFLNAIDVFVLPSLSEGSPFSLLEAMACGKAIIASDIPAIREIVEDGKEALLFDPDNPHQLKNLMLTLYNNPKLRKKLGENARRKAKQYDVNIIFRKITQVYNDILVRHAMA